MQKLLKAIYSEDKLQQLFQKLKKSTLSLKEYSWPMIPYVGPDYAKADKKIMFVGKEPNGWGRNPCSLGEILNEPDGIERIISEPTRFILEDVVPYYGGKKGYNTNLLLRLYYFAGNILCDKPVEPNTRDKDVSLKCFRSIVMTNIFKICKQEEGSGKAFQPDSKMKNFLLSNFNTLEYEIDQLKPDLIVFSTGSSYDRYLVEIFPKIKFIEIHQGIEAVNGFTTKVFRTYHFGFRGRHSYVYAFLDKLIDLSFPSK